jgi:hypothetical protein
MRKIMIPGLAMLAMIGLVAVTPAHAQGNSPTQVGPGSAAKQPDGNPNQVTPTDATKQKTDSPTQVSPVSDSLKQKSDGEAPTQVGPGSGAYKKQN